MSSPTSDTDPFGRDTSGSTAFRMTTKDIITEAFDLLQIGVEGEDIEQDMYDRAKRSLNLLLQTWQGQGIHLWTYQEAVLFPVAGQNAYVLEQENVTKEFTQSSVALTLPQGTTQLINDTAGQQDLSDFGDLDEGWYIGFMKSDCTIWWTTIADKTRVVMPTVIDTFTLADPTPEEFDVDTIVVFYEKRLSLVDRVLDVRRRDQWQTVNENETPIHLVSHQEYFALPNKRAQGIPSEAYYQRNLPQGTLYLWQTPINANTLISITYERGIDDFVDNDDCADIPKYWLDAICNNLAKKLTRKYRVPPEITQMITMDAEETLNQALSHDDANYDINITINRSVR